ncbi:hypothetical protein ACLMJK_009305 [Lecanora helva]
MAEPIEVDDEEAISSANATQGAYTRAPSISTNPEPRSGSEESRNSTKSLTPSSLSSPILENSRHYTNTTYHMPADPPEATRLTILHQSALPLLSPRLTLTHIPPTATRILDIGTGTADWAIAVAEAHPHAEVIATDITTSFQPATAPPNLFFELDDATQEWAYTSPFDFIHIRGLAGAFTAKQWERVYEQAAKHLKPGGTLEVADFGEIHLECGQPDTHLQTYNHLLRTACTALNAPYPLSLSHLLPAAFTSSNLSITKSKSFHVPLGTWDPDPAKKVAGKMALIAALEGLEAQGLRLVTRGCEGWGEEAFRGLCEGVRGEVVGGRGRVEWRVVGGRGMG